MYEIDITTSTIEIGYVADNQVKKQFYPNMIEGEPEMEFTTWNFGNLNVILSNLSLKYMKKNDYVPLMSN